MHGGQHRDAPLGVPLEQHLMRALPELLRHGGHRGVAQHRRVAACEGACRHALHALAEQHAHHLAIRQLRVQLHLIDGRLDAAACHDLLHRREPKVGHADRLHQALVHQLLHGRPGILHAHATVELLGAGQPGLRPFHEVEVQVLAAKVRQGLGARRLDGIRLVGVVGQLRHEVELLAGSALQALAHRGLVAVAWRAVEQAKALGDGVLDILRGSQVVGAQTQQWHVLAGHVHCLGLGHRSERRLLLGLHLSHRHLASAARCRAVPCAMPSPGVHVSRPGEVGLRRALLAAPAHLAVVVAGGGGPVAPEVWAVHHVREAAVAIPGGLLDAVARHADSRGDWEK
mmetsp:Transcript_44840/g.112411  ORF Transcript_44840/g.112411 Transcript_44840/m.112411 type:complete len:343 (-) Transcript_44840:203-1231(-)